MSKANLGLADFTIAHKSAGRTPVADVPDVSAELTSPESVGSVPSEVEDREVILQKRSPAERQKRAKERAIAQEEARYSIKNLKRAKQREVKFFVNVALDQETKARLKRAADENDLKMAT
jgi:hypothetical protein